MNSIVYFFQSFWFTLFRLVPWPCRTGLVRIGKPDRNSPVFLTGNYALTVARVKRALTGLDVYLLVANSHGVNVWCAATGGHFSHHEVLSVLKTSGIQELVAHRKVILPQLAATGVEAKVIKKKSGWSVIWGPVYARDIPLFLKQNLSKEPGQCQVEFPLPDRLQMAFAWAFPVSLLAAVLTLLFRTALFPPLLALIWGSALLVFSVIPLLGGLLSRRGPLHSFLGQMLLPVLLWSLVLAALLLRSGVGGELPWSEISVWGAISLATLVILNIDLRGMTPLFRSGLHENRFRVVLDPDLCRCRHICLNVCPRNCFAWADKNPISLAAETRCVQCGACIVQCPFDALRFKSHHGETVPPETIRKFKLNLLGRRVQAVDRN